MHLPALKGPTLKSTVHSLGLAVMEFGAVCPAAIFQVCKNSSSQWCCSHRHVNRGMRGLKLCGRPAVACIRHETPVVFSGAFALAYLFGCRREISGMVVV